MPIWPRSRGLPERQVNTYLAQAARKGCAELVAHLLKDGASVQARGARAIPRCIIPSS